MKKIYKILGCICVLWVTSLSLPLRGESISNIDTAQLSSEANILVQQYFSALEVGEIDTIRGILGGELLIRRQRLLSNPTYSNILQETYENAQFTIKGVDVQADMSVLVDARIILKSANRLNVKLILADLGQTGLHIINEF